LEIAHTLSVGEQRTILLQMAQVWQRLADHNKGRQRKRNSRSSPNDDNDTGGHEKAPGSDRRGPRRSLSARRIDQSSAGDVWGLGRVGPKASPTPPAPELLLQSDGFPMLLGGKAAALQMLTA
jgi:hypothetical protein